MMPARAKPVNFVYLRSDTYAGVQDQIFELIERHLEGVEATRTVEYHVDHAINFGLHIRRGRGTASRPMPIDVLMSHGLADKSYLLASDARGRRLINAYEHVLVAGDWFRRRLVHRRWHLPSKRVSLRPGQIHIVGWPRLDPLFEAEAERAPTVGRRRLLWAPSHDVSTRARSFSSYPAFEPYLAELAGSFDVRASLHPTNRTDKSPTAGDLTWADIVVSDFGTMLYEAWALGKCVIMPTWLLPAAIGAGLTQRWSAEGRVYSRRIGNHASSFAELVDMARACRPPGPDVQALMADILAEPYRGSSARRIASILPTLPLRRLGER
ncbi:MAG TPA: hypothetical protein VFT56_14105 [Sphingomonas sp.]|nr:hypothetical protein [Sphingomonas sp.]